MRGKRSARHGQHIDRRLIPAHAGKTDSVCQLLRRVGAHPRACGENGSGVAAVVSSAGSSPRMRGKRRPKAKTRRSRGLIPAHAGKTGAPDRPGHLRPAHPRACGENAERSGVLTLRSVRSWKTLSFPSSLKVTHCRTFVQLSLSSIRL